MQILELCIYGNNKKKRSLKFQLGKVNIITGSSTTGKSVVGDIIEYCLGGDSCEIAAGIVRNSVSWYGVLLQFDNERIFVARQNPSSKRQSTNKFYYIVGNNSLSTPDTAEFNSITNTEGIEKLLSSKLGITENLNIPPLGQTRDSLEANIRHALIYNFQKQNEIATKEFLFHRQYENYMPQTIKDVFPYFLGILEKNTLELESKKRLLKRKINIKEREIDENKKIKGNGLKRATSLLSEAISVGLIDENLYINYKNYDELVSKLKLAVEWIPNENYSMMQGGMDRLSKLQQDLADKELELSQNKIDISDAKVFLGDIKGYTSEMEYGRKRLESIGIFDNFDFEDDHCPFCSSKLDEPLPSIDAIKNEAKNLERNLKSVTEDRPKLRKYIDEMQEKVEKIREDIKNIKSQIDGIYNKNISSSKIKDLNNRRSIVVGRISLWLESVEFLNDYDYINTEKSINNLKDKLEIIEKLLDKNNIEDRKESVLRRISNDMTKWAEELNLEHCENPIRLDLNKLTAIVDFPNRYVTLQQLGSGSNWVGIHLIVYFALHKYFIDNDCPVPHFIFLDQPSQVYFPSETDESKYDIRAVKKLYKFIFKRVKEMKGELQVIIVDHANFVDEQFQKYVLENWSKDGLKLIPDSWYNN